MIFPKDQQHIKTAMNDQLKRQALQLIISLYLQRSKDEDLIFLNNNFGSTSSLASGIRSHLSNGLPYENIQLNRIQYGQNEKLRPLKCSPIQVTIKNQVTSLYFIIVTLICLIAEIYGRLANNYLTHTRAETIFVANSSAVIVRVILQYIFCRKFLSYSLLKDKTNLYQVFRNGKLLQISEHQLVVGDIVQLGFKQKVPASGLIISGKQIFVKEGKSQLKIQSKMNLENCISKLKGMNALDLKLCYQGKNLPSPVLIRGSELIYGSTYQLMILSVTQQHLLHSHKFSEEDKFSFKKYDNWIMKIQQKWHKKTIVAIILMAILVTFTNLISKDMIYNHQKVTFKVFCDILMIISNWLLVFNSANFKAFLKIKQLALLIEVEIPENWPQYLIAQRILCDEKNIVKSDVVRVLKYAVCQKMDILDANDVNALNPITVNIISQIQQIFDVESPFKMSRDLSDQQRLSKFIITNKKKTKIISCPTVKNSDSNLMRTVYDQIVKVSDNPIATEKKNQHRLSLKQPTNQPYKANSHQLLSVPKQNSQLDNINEIINSRCQIKSRGVLAGIIQLAEKGCKTYYYQIFDNQKMEEITHLLNNGIISQITEQDRERMKMLARKISLVYDLTPIMLGFHDGSYSQKPLRILACLIGVNISQDNKILQALKQLQEIDVKSTIIICKNANDDQQQSNQQQINIEYVQRKWIESESESIKDIEKIKKLCGRLVCSSCLIANCDCKDKIQQISHIQPFIQQSNSMKVLYNVDQYGLSYIETAYSQLQLNYITINSSNISALAVIQSIKNCRLFIDGILRSLSMWYLLSILFAINPLLFWIRNIDVLTVGQITVSFGLSQIQLMACFLFKINVKISDTYYNKKKKICFMGKKQTVFIIVIVLLTVAISQILFSFSYVIPEQVDAYDQLIKSIPLPRQCKYSQGLSTVTNQFSFQICYLAGQKLVQSKISSIIHLYLYCVFWMTVFIRHQNIRSLPCVIMYGIIIVISVIICYWAPSQAFLYPYGITTIQILVVAFSVFITLILAVTITQIILIYDNQLEIYFGQQLQNSMDFESQKQLQHYSYILKKYQKQKTYNKENQIGL